jgi:hypothetical protein
MVLGSTRLYSRLRSLVPYGQARLEYLGWTVATDLYPVWPLPQAGTTVSLHSLGEGTRACVAYSLVVKTGTSLSSAEQYSAPGFGYSIACIVKIVYT